MRGFTFLFVFLLTNASWASRPEGLYGGFGLALYNMGKIATPGSDIESIGSPYVPLHARAYKALAHNIYFSPHIYFTPIGLKSQDQTYTSRLMYLGLPLSYSFKPSWDASAGVGYMSYILSANGGTVADTSGNTRGAPNSQSYQTYYLEFGISKTDSGLNGAFDLLVSGLFSSKYRVVMAVFTCNFGLLEFE